MLSKEELLNTWIPYRLESVRTFREALKWTYEYDSTANTQIFINGEPKLSGTRTAVTNPLIEVGFIHSRALLGFMGITLNKHGKLFQRSTRKDSDDIVIEHYQDLQGNNLDKVKVEMLYKNYHGSKEDAEQAFTALLKTANKAVAHITQHLSAAEADVYDLAARGIPVLIESNLYIKLGRKLPDKYFR